MLPPYKLDLAAAMVMFYIQRKSGNLSRYMLVTNLHIGVKRGVLLSSQASCFKYCKDKDLRRSRVAVILTYY